jgi:hypothetical protein
MKSKGNLGWNWFDFGIADTRVFNNGVNQSRLSKFIEVVTMFIDADSYIICWVALILNVESQTLDFLDCLKKLCVIISQEDTIIHVDHKNDVTVEEDTIINQQKSIAQ